MKGCILHLHRTSMRTICSCLSLWGRCSGKPCMRYICALSFAALTLNTVFQAIFSGCVNCDFCTLRASLWTSLLPPSSSVKSWVTTTALSTAPLTSCPHWTLSSTRTSRPSRSATITLKAILFFADLSHFHLCLTFFILFVFSAL